MLVGILSGGVGTECGWLKPSIFTPIGPELPWLTGLASLTLPPPGRPPSRCRTDKHRFAVLRRTVSALQPRVAHHPRDKVLAGRLRRDREALRRATDAVYERC